MIDYAILPVYLTAVIALLLIPGPDMLLIASSSLSYGKKVGLSASLGNATSGILLTLLASLGVSALIAMSPIALQVLHLAGAAYLLKMGWDCLRTTPSDAPELQAQSHLARILYRRAIFTNLLNPKALIFFVLFLPQFVSTHIATSSGEQMLILGLILNLMGLLFNIGLVTMIGTVGKSLLNSPKFRTNQHKVMGIVFLILAAWLLLSDVTAPILHH